MLRPVGRSTWLRLCAAAGIVGPLLFTATFLVQEQIRRDEYSPIAEPVSALEAGPNGWVQQLNFVVFAVLLFAFAVGLHHGVQSTRFGFAGPAIIAWGGVGLVLAAVFPLREDVTGATYNPTGLHYMSGPIVFSSIGVGLVVLSRRLARDPSGAVWPTRPSERGLLWSSCSWSLVFSSDPTRRCCTITWGWHSARRLLSGSPV